jgi:membrane-associated phospholipid phosphatase
MVCSRVIAGVHYFGDIFVGSILGALCAWAYSAIRIKIGTQTPLHQLPVKIANFIRL